ncbi:MAG: DUF4238 domain-containing protein [Hyphomicrobiaceae bacterium]
MPTARRHHFITAAYLNGFAADPAKPELHVFDLVRRKTRVASPRSVAWVRDFNTIDTPRREPDELERLLGQIEGDVIAAIRRIDAAGSLAQKDDLHLVLNLVGMFAARNPDLRGRLEQFTRDFVMRMAKLSVQSPEMYAQSARRHGTSDYEDMKAFIDGGEFKISIKRNFLIGQELAVAGPIVDMLARRRWSLLKTDPVATGGFITSDHPVCLDWTNPMPKGPFNSPGFGLTSTVVVFPLTRRMCLIGSFELEARELQVGFKQVAFMNGAIVASAREYAFAADDMCVFMAEGRDAPTMCRDLLATVPAAAHQAGRR